MAIPVEQRRTLWLAFAAGPLAWIAEMGVNYSYSYPDCANGHLWVLLIVCAAALLVTLTGMGLAARQWRALPPEPSAHSIALALTLLNGIFALLIVAQAFPLVLTGGCG